MQEGIGILAAVYLLPSSDRLSWAHDHVVLGRGHQAATPQNNGHDIEEPKISKEIRTMPNEPLLPVEKKLIDCSLWLGMTLLLVLFLVNRFFPITGG